MTDRPRMLIVEDDRDTAEMLAAYFEAQGYTVTPVAWGVDAVRQAQEGATPDLILLDIRLPDIDGFEVCKRLRSHRRTQYIPIIFLTEKRERGDRLSGLELGAVDYITKPFDVQDLRLRVRNILRRTKFHTLVHPVTGLPDQVLVDERLDGLLSQRHWALLTLQVIGLDAFADRYGFVARDDALRALALLMNNSVNESQADPKSSFVGQLNDNSFIIIVEAGRAHEVRNWLTARIKQSAHFFYPAKEHLSADERPQLTFTLGVITAESGPYADGEAVKAAGLQSMRPVL